MSVLAKLQAAGLRATAQRMAIGQLLLDGADRHVTADDVSRMAREAGVRVSLATVYNTLNQFVAAGLLKRIVLDTERTFFDTNLSDHHHLLFEDSGRLQDLAAGTVKIEGLPQAPEGAQVRSVDVIVRVGPAAP